MLRINQSRNLNQAKSYYSETDYYLGNEQELVGQWRGEGARRLGLDGDVTQDDWSSLCDNRDPRSGARLTARQRSDRTIGYDFNFHVPKSVSLLYAETRDERILDAFRESVDATMSDVECEAQTRVRKNRQNENRRTGNLVWGEFIHFTSRPVDGIPDPHLHAHCYVFNVTHDDQEQIWKAGQFRELKRDAPYFEALFHARLAHKLVELGLPIDRTNKGWELAGIDKPLVRAFSRRTTQVEEKAREMGIESPAEKSELGAKTREHKQQHLSFAELQESWQQRMKAKERQVLAGLAQQIGGAARPIDSKEASRSVAYAIEHEFERLSVVPERMMMATALKHAAGKATVGQVLRQFENANLIIGERDGRRMATTRQVLAEEETMVDFARSGRGTCRPFVGEINRFKRDWLNENQKSAVRHIAQSRDRVILLRGAAGVGKTTLMQEAVDAIESNGTRVFAFAPSAEASRGVLRSDGFKQADTVAMLLKDERQQRAAAGNLIWIDEAGLLGSRTMTEVFALAKRINARVLLSGDRYQHGSVQRGAALRLLEEEAGLKPANVVEIQRQSGRYKRAVKALSEGKVAEGFKGLNDLGWIREIAGGDRYRQMATDYVESVAQGKSALVVSPTHAEGDRITAEIRRQLKTNGTIGSDQRSFRVLSNANLTEAERGDETNFSHGDVLVFHQNAKGFRRGQRVSVTADATLPIDQRARFGVFHSRRLSLAVGDRVRITQNGYSADGQHRLNNGSLYQVKAFDRSGNIVLDNGWTVSKDFGHLAHGYVSTSHSSQGKTVQRVFVGQGDASLSASSREQFYVSASRAKEQTIVYTGNKDELLEAVRRTDERLTASEFVGSPFPPMVPDFPDRPERYVGHDRTLHEVEILHER